ncbi:MAG: 2-oxo acid dehydrogenase subunit E2, partial [Pseudomonadota bacterium]
VDFPTIADADQRSAWSITEDLANVMRDAKTGEASADGSRNLTPQRHSTAAIANLGRGAISRYQTPLSPTHATVLALAGAQPRLVPPEPASLSGPLPPASNWHPITSLEVTLGCDTRMMSGVIAADLLSAFVEHLEAPAPLFATFGTQATAE